MAYCIIKENIEKLKKAFQSLDSKDRLKSLIDMNENSRVSLFRNAVGDDEAILLNKEFERVVATKKASAMKKFVNENLNEEFRKKRVDDRQLKSIQRFIDDKKKTRKPPEIVPIKDLVKMSDEEQLKVLRGIMDEKSAIETQSKIKLATKNPTERAIDKALKDFTNLKDFNKDMDLIANNVSMRNDRILLGFDEVEEITNLSNDIEKAKKKWIESGSDEDRIAYGESIFDLNQRVGKLKYDTNVKEVAKKILVSSLSLPKVTTATGELSFFGIQLFQSLFRKEFWEGVGILDIYNAALRKNVPKKNFFRFAKEENLRRLSADIITRENSKLYKKHGLKVDIGGSNLSSKEDELIGNYIFDKLDEISKEKNIPVISKGFSSLKKVFIDAPSNIFSGALAQMRADTFDKALAGFESSGVKLGNKEYDSLTRTVNAFTGGSSFGQYEKVVPILNSVLWSPRLIKSKLDMVRSIKPAISGVGKVSTGKILLPNEKEAIKSLASLASASIAMYNLALFYKKYSGKEDVSVETDPKSSDFGEIRVGKTRLSISGNNSTYATLLARIITGKTKSSSTGVEYELGKGQTGDELDFITDFTRGKLNPLVGFFVDMKLGKNVVGEKFELKKDLIEMSYPLTYQAIYDVIMGDDFNSSEKAAVSALSFIGFSASTYKSKNWEDTVDDTKKLKQFREKVGAEKFREANNTYNERVDKKFAELRNSEDFKVLSNENKKKVVTSSTLKIQNDIFKEYGFTYKEKKEDKVDLKKFSR